MKKRIIAIAAAIIMTFPVNSLAAPTEFSGGVNNEYEYEEVAFLSGAPVKFTGTCKISETGSKEKKTVSYTFKLTSSDTANPGKIDRQMSYQTVAVEDTATGQTISKTENTKMKESITIGADKYDLKDYQFSKSDFTDNRPAADYYSGNLKARKYYTINGDQGTVIIDISGGEVGYNNFWGTTGTQIIDQIIKSEKIAGTEQSAKSQSWQGTVRILSSDSTVNTIRYSDNEATYSSFEGGNLKLTNREMVSKMDFDLPVLGSDGAPKADVRNTGTFELIKRMDPKVERLPVSKLKDIGGHWAEDDINKLYSTGVYDDRVQFFTPDIPMTRKEYIRAVMRACNIIVQVPKIRTVSSRNKTPEVSIFEDVDINDKDYLYVKEAYTKGIIHGITDKQFAPDAPLTRVESVALIVRALGFENRAPVPGFVTAFEDDSAIPQWSKDSVYVAREIGLIQGDEANRFNPGRMMTRAEASVMLTRFLEFLQKDLQKDYRENIILYK